MPEVVKRTIFEEHPCKCTEAAMNTVSSIKSRALNEVACKECGKTILANFDTDYYFGWRRKIGK